MVSNTKLLNEFKAIASKVSSDDALEALDYVRKSLDSGTPSHEISIIGLYIATMRIYRHIPSESQERFMELVDKVNEVLVERGYRTDYMTHQEHSLLGSTVWEGYAKEPHKPIGVIKGNLTVDEARKARELSKKQPAFGKYFCLESRVNISYEPLDENGNTTRDPQVLDDKLKPIPTKYSDDFPFRRK